MAVIYYIQKNKLAFYSLAFLLVLLGGLAPLFLHAKFYYDANLIALDPLNERSWKGSYPITMMLYHLSGLRFLPYSVVALIQLPFVFWGLRQIGIPERFHILNLKNAVVYLAFLMMVIFIGQPSKEFITYFFSLAILLVLVKEWLPFYFRLTAVFVLLVAFGVVYRPYYVFIPFIATAMYALTFIRIKNKVFFALINGILVLTFISVTYGFVKGSNLSVISRETVNEERMHIADANSMILSPVNPATWYGETVSAFYGFFTVNFPINGLKFFSSPQIVAFVLWQLLLSSMLLLRFSKQLNRSRQDAVVLWVLLIVFAYFIIQGIFEPDLGSAVRHKIGIFPLIYYCLYHEDFRKKLSDRI